MDRLIDCEFQNAPLLQLQSAIFATVVVAEAAILSSADMTNVGMSA